MNDVHGVCMKILWALVREIIEFQCRGLAAGMRFLIKSLIIRIYQRSTLDLVNVDLIRCHTADI